MTNQEKLYKVARECLGKDMAPFEDEYGCAEAINGVFKKAFGRDIGGGLSTYRMYDVLRSDTRFQKILTPTEGDIIISPTGYGNGRQRNGHVGLISEKGKIMSNNSYNGLWEENYSLETWKRKYKDFGGFPMDCFRAITPPQIQPITPTYTPQIQPNTSMPSWMSNFLWRNSQKLGAFLGFRDQIFGGVPRSPKWNKFRNDFLKTHPFCEACGVKAEVAHHAIPYSVDPRLELRTENILALCDECHLVLAHLKSFRRYNKDIRETAKLFRQKIEEWS